MMHMLAEVKLQALQVKMSEVCVCRCFNDALLRFHAIQMGSFPAELEVFASEPQPEWRLTMACGCSFLMDGKSILGFEVTFCIV